MVQLKNILALGLLLFCSLLLGQKDKNLEEYHNHIEGYDLYMNARLYTEAIKEMQSAIDLCIVLNDERNSIKHQIQLAEVYRVVGDFERALEILLGLGELKGYPELEIKRVGRWTAIYHEAASLYPENWSDTISAIYESNIKKARKFGFSLIEADLLNQLGFWECRSDNFKSGYPKFLRSAKLFKEHGQLENEAVALSNALAYVDPFHDRNDPNDYKFFQQKYDSLQIKIKDKGWHAIDVKVENFMSGIYGMRRDSMKYWRHGMNAVNANIRLVNQTHNDQLAAYSVIHETQEAKNDAIEQKQIANERSIRLKDKEAQTKQLIWAVLLMSLVILAVIITLLRERKLKSTIAKAADELHVANENYHMLLVESNHRIKNNLQMIISMLDYEGTRTEIDGDDRLRKMSINVQTISALHKHLYADVHNQEVNLISYLNEIVQLYAELTPHNFKLVHGIDEILIGSERIIYFGLLFNEMLSNTIEHAAIGNSEIVVSITRNKEGYQFLYEDGAKWKSHSASSGMGTLLIRQFVVRVKGENFILNRQKGQYTFEFNA